MDVSLFVLVVRLVQPLFVSIGERVSSSSSFYKQWTIDKPFDAIPPSVPYVSELDPTIQHLCHYRSVILCISRWLELGSRLYNGRLNPDFA